MAELWPGGPITLPHDCTIDDVALTIPEIPVPTLLGWLSTGAWWHLLPDAVDLDQRISLMVRFADDNDEFTFEHFWHPATTLMGRLAGTHPTSGHGTGWWPAVRLAATATAHWTVFTAWCAGRGTDPLGGPLWQVTGTIYGWLRSMREGGGEQELAKLDQEIWTPPPMRNAADPDHLPRHVREEEAKLAMAALGESLPGEDRVSEWTPS